MDWLVRYRVVIKCYTRIVRLGASLGGKSDLPRKCKGDERRKSQSVVWEKEAEDNHEISLLIKLSQEINVTRVVKEFPNAFLGIC